MKPPKITFVAYGLEQLSISLLSAIAKKNGYEVGLAYAACLFQDNYLPYINWLSKLFDDNDNIYEAIAKQKPDILAFSAVTSSYQNLLKIARKAKELYPNIKIVFGGVHVSALPERVIKQNVIDYIVIGEGDYAFIDIIKAIESGDYTTPIQNTWFKDKNGNIIKGVQKGFIQDLDSLPYFDKQIWEDYINIGDLYFTSVSRGCPFKCTFCFNNYFKSIPTEKRGKYVRFRSVDNVIDELKQAKKRYHIKYVDFVDDMFTFDKVWLKEFLNRYKEEINIPFHCMTHSHYIDEEVAQWLGEANCIIAEVGAQTFDDDYKKKTLHRIEKAEGLAKTIDLLIQNKIITTVHVIMGLPNEPIEAQEINLDFFKKHTPSKIEPPWYIYIPGTELMMHAINTRVISHEQAESILEGKEINLCRKGIDGNDKQKMKVYNNYIYLYKLLPILPNFISKKMSYAKFSKYPLSIKKGLAFIANVVSHIQLKEPHFNLQKKHILFQLYRIFRKKLHLKPPKASKIYS